MKRQKYSSLTQIGTGANTVLHIIFLIWTAICVLPFLLLVSVSLSSSSSITLHGYRFIPHEFSLGAYDFMLNRTSSLLRAYGISVFTTVVGTVLNVIITLLFAYPLSRKDFKYRNILSFIIFFSMIFQGGLVANYMIKVQLLNLKNTIWVYIVGALFSSWNCMLMRTFLTTSIPDALVEAAKIDGAGEYRAFFSIIVPLSLPGIATIALLCGIGIWNDWFTGMMYITDASLNNLQYMMYQILDNIEYLKSHLDVLGSEAAAALRDMPTEAARMAMCILSVGPIIIIYPFVQKYFVKGMVIGAVKG